MPTNGNGRDAMYGQSYFWRIKQYRCRACSRLIFNGRLSKASQVEIRCPRCQTLLTWTGNDLPAKPSKIERETLRQDAIDVPVVKKKEDAHSPTG